LVGLAGRAGVLLHSDQGSQYASSDFGKALAAHGFVPNMSCKGGCWDNAVAESFFVTLKNEKVIGPWETKVAARAVVANFLSMASTVPLACARFSVTCRPTVMLCQKAEESALTPCFLVPAFREGICSIYAGAWGAFAEVLLPERHVIGKGHAHSIECDNGAAIAMT
jgi:hypothetical protein